MSPPAPTYDYTIEDTITYKGSTWHVIKNSPSNENYVTLMRETVLSNAELGQYADSTYDTALFDKTSPYSNDYATSNVKAAVEAYATANNMMSDLAEVDGYKIRLITQDELIDNFAFIDKGGYYQKTSTTPSFVYSNFGEKQNNVGGYWTMTPDANNASQVWWFVSSGGRLYTYIVDSGISGVRPVINLLKSAISTQ